MKIKFFIIIFFNIVFIESITNAIGNRNIFYLPNIGSDPITIYANLRGTTSKEKQKIVLKQKYIGQSAKGDEANIEIKVYETDKIVFEYKEKYEPILYAYLLRFPGRGEDIYRDILFIVTEPGNLKLNILSWESLTSDAEKVKLPNGKVTFKNVHNGKYRFIKTDVQIMTPYG